MASAVPKFQTLVTVEEFRDLIKTHFAKQLADGEAFDKRDIERFNQNDEYTLMFIQHGQFEATFNKERSFRIFNGSMSWRKTNKVYDISSNEFPSAFSERRVIFFQNHDRSQHRILHFVTRAYEKGQDESEAIKRFITYNLEQHLRDYPGQKIVLLFDLAGAGLRQLDYDLTKFIIASLQTYYPGILAYMLIYKMPFLLSAAWKIIRTWLATEAEQFIKFVDAKSITEYVAPAQLSPEMGGTAPANS